MGTESSTLKGKCEGDNHASNKTFFCEDGTCEFRICSNCKHVNNGKSVCGSCQMLANEKNKRKSLMTVSLEEQK
jgi:hypothetical protein